MIMLCRYRRVKTVAQALDEPLPFPVPFFKFALRSRPWISCRVA